MSPYLLKLSQPWVNNPENNAAAPVLLPHTGRGCLLDPPDVDRRMKSLMIDKLTWTMLR